MNYVLAKSTGGPTDLTTSTGPAPHGPALGQFTAPRSMTLRASVRLTGLNSGSKNTYTARIYHLDSAGSKIGETISIAFTKLAGDTKVTMHLTGASVPVLRAGERAEVHVLSSGPGDAAAFWEVHSIDEQSANDLTPEATQVLARSVGAFRGRVWFVDPNATSGNDGKSPVTAFKTIDAATGVAQAGDLIKLAAATFDLGAGRVVLPDDVSLKGAGRRLTKIASTAAIASGGGIIVKAGKRSRVSDMTIEGTASSALQGPIGWYFGEGVSDSDCDLATFENLDLIGNSDGLFLSGVNGVTVFLRRIRTRTKYDSIAVYFGGLLGGIHTVYIWDSIIESIGPSDANPARGMNVQTGSRIVAINCDIRAANSTTKTVACLVDTNGGEIRPFNCRVDVSGSSPELYSLSNEHPSGVLRASGCAFDRALVNFPLRIVTVPVQCNLPP